MSKANETVFPIHQDVTRGMAGNFIKSGPLSGGLSKREYFAAMAMQGAIAGCDRPPTKENMCAHARGWAGAADALLAELEKP